VGTPNFARKSARRPGNDVSPVFSISRNFP